MWYTHTRCAHSPQTVGGSTCSAVIKPSVTSAHSSIHAHRVAGVTAESERGSAEVRCHGVQSMSGTTAIVSVTSRSGPHAMIIALTGSSRKGGSADVARPALYCGHSHPVMVDWHAPPRSHSHGVTAHSSCGSAPSAQSCAHDALAEEGAAPMMMRRKAGVRRRKVFLYYCRQDRPRRERGSAKRQIPQSGFVLSVCIYHGVTTSPFVYPRIVPAQYTKAPICQPLTQRHPTGAFCVHLPLNAVVRRFARGRSLIRRRSHLCTPASSPPSATLSGDHGGRVSLLRRNLRRCACGRRLGS